MDKNLDAKVTKHTLSYVIYIYLIWMFITTISSSMPMVSVKFLLTKLWFITVFFFMATAIFKKKENIYRFLYLMMIAMAIAVTYTLFMHSQNGFTSEAAHWVMYPFFKDHTVYGAVLAMFMPVGLAFLFLKDVKTTNKLVVIGINVLFFVGMVFSYTRAAWLSLVAGLAVYIVILLRISFKTIATVFVSLLLLFFVYQDQVLYLLSKNTQDSSQNFMENIQSMSNITSDASNLERLNRWNSAIKMFQDRPVTGFGPGTYQFNYGVFQKWSETTIISTNDGSMGNAHSEYLGPLSEQGLPGMLIFLAVIITFSIVALRTYRKLPKGDLKTIVVACYIGLFTYYIHGILNNYLDTDKASVPFWGFMALIVAIEVYHLPSLEKKTIESKE